MIKIHKKDSIIDIIIKIQNSLEKEIILDFPFGHPILHNSTSLRILKNKAGNKKLIIITNDLSAKKIGETLGIKYSLLNNTNLLEFNYTFFEYLNFIIKNYISEMKNYFFNNKNKNNNLNSLFKNNIKYNKSRIGFFIFGLIVSVFLLLFIFYFAVNKTYVYIKPEITIKNRSTNLIFKEIKDEQLIYEDNRTVKIKKILKTVNLQSSFGTTGFIEKDIHRSKGQVIIKNYTNEEIGLLPNTRLETGSGIIYTIPNSINIPKSIKNNSGTIIPGTIKINILSKIYDKKGKIIGERGNILSGTKLIFPGLKEQSDKIFAESIIDFKGGNSKIDKIISKNDIQNAKLLLESELKTKVLKELKKEIKLNNKKNNNQFNILGVNNILEYTNLKITGYEDLEIGKKTNKFELYGEITLKTYIYNKDQVLNIINNKIKTNIIEGVEKILYINDKSLRISNIIYKTSNPLTIKATVGVEVFFIHNFINNSDNYIHKLKNSIMGLEKNDALNVLLNDPKISDVSIKIRPFFIKKISKIYDNIIIKILDK